MMQSADDLLAHARRRIGRVQPPQLRASQASGELVVDIRSEAARCAEGVLDGAVIVERNVLEWRLDPLGRHRIPEVRDHSQWIVVMCSEGYASSLAAVSLFDLGLEHAADLEGGFQARRAWSDRKVVRL
jgi:rhodanese-related sulfurtransferase